MFEVIKVIVKGELPESCFTCRGATRYKDEGEPYICSVKVKELGKSEFRKRPDWCPLMPEREVFNWIMHRAPTKEECESEE